MKEIVKYLVKVVQVASEAWCRRAVRTQKVSRTKKEKSFIGVTHEKLSLLSKTKKKKLKKTRRCSAKILSQTICSRQLK